MGKKLKVISLQEPSFIQTHLRSVVPRLALASMEKDLPSEAIALKLSLLDPMVNQHFSQQTSVLLPSM